MIVDVPPLIVSLGGRRSCLSGEEAASPPSSSAPPRLRRAAASSLSPLRAFRPPSSPFLARRGLGRLLRRPPPPPKGSLGDGEVVRQSTQPRGPEPPGLRPPTCRRIEAGLGAVKAAAKAAAGGRATRRRSRACSRAAVYMVVSKPRRFSLSCFLFPLLSSSLVLSRLRHRSLRSVSTQTVDDEVTL